MCRYLIADLVIDIKTEYEFSRKLMRGYLYRGDRPDDFTVRITPDMIDYERRVSPGDYASEYLETVAVLRAVCMEILRKHSGFFFHCSSFKFEDKGYLFTAPSGTGKSTHTRLWREHFGDRVTMINDDKPIIRLEHGRFYIYGTPWQGKENQGNNIKSTVDAVCILARGKQNKVRRVAPLEAFKAFIDQTERPNDRQTMEKLVDMLGKMAETVPVYYMECTPDDGAVAAAYNAIVAGKQD